MPELIRAYRDDRQLRAHLGEPLRIGCSCALMRNLQDIGSQVRKLPLGDDFDISCQEHVAGRTFDCENDRLIIG